MAKVEGLIPFLIYFETGVKDSNSDCKSLFEKAKGKGIVNDPDDKGGATLVGITLTTYQEYCKRHIRAGRQRNLPDPNKKPEWMTAEDLLKLSYDEWLEILKTMFWDRWQADFINSQSLAEMLVDWVWTSGKYGITIPQRKLGVAADGIVGQKTLAAVNAADSETLFAQMKAARIDYIESICRSRVSNYKFRAGWLRRINSMSDKQMSD